MASPCEISVIVPTYRRPTVCAALVSRLLHDLPDNAEVVVVAQQTPFAVLHDSRLRSVCLRKASLTRARNAGIDAAQGDLVLFLDDDCVPDPGLVATHLALHRQYAGFAAIAGMVRDRHNRGVNERVVVLDERTLTLRTDYAVQREEEVPCGPGGHLSLKRGILDKVRFDPWFAGNAHFEEVDFAFRLRRHGGRILFSKRAAMDHAIEESGGCRSETTPTAFYRNRFYNRGLCFSKNCPLRHTGRFLAAQKREIEFYSRAGRGHRVPIAAAGATGVLAGLAAGTIRRSVGDARYR